MLTNIRNHGLRIYCLPFENWKFDSVDLSLKRREKYELSWWKKIENTRATRRRQPLKQAEKSKRISCKQPEESSEASCSDNSTNESPTAHKCAADILELAATGRNPQSFDENVPILAVHRGGAAAARVMLAAVSVATMRFSRKTLWFVRHSKRCERRWTLESRDSTTKTAKICVLPVFR